MFKIKIAGAIPQKSSLTFSVGFVILITLGVRVLAWMNKEAANKVAKKVRNPLRCNLI